MTEEEMQNFYEQESTLDAILKEAGVPTPDQFMGLILSTESAGLDDKRMEQAFHDWTRYYAGNDTNFGWVLCHLICKADIHNLHRISKGFPEHVRVFAEKNIIAVADPDKVEQVMNDEQ